MPVKVYFWIYLIINIDFELSISHKFFQIHLSTSDIFFISKKYKRNNIFDF